MMGCPKNETVEKTNEKLSLKIAIVGGGRACRLFLRFIQDEPIPDLNINVAGVCDIDPDAEGFRLARKMGIYTTNRFEDLFKIKDLNTIIELTGNREVLLELIRVKPKGLGVLDHNIGRFLRHLLMKDQQLQSAEEQVLREKMAADFLIQQANERISVLNPDFTIAEANEAYLKAVGKSREEVIGAHCYEITHGLGVPCSSSQHGLGCPLIETIRSGESAHIIHEHYLSEEYPTYCDMVTYPMKDENGEVVRIIEVSRDLTEELSSRVENHVREIKADLKKVIQEDRMISLGKLVASSVHEINNPIQGLLTFSHLIGDMLEEGEPGPEDLEKLREFLALMCTELERCGNIVSGLLSFSRQSGMEIKDVDLNEILNQVIILTRHKMDLQNIRIDTRLHPEPLIVHGGMNELQQCFLNLIFNAIEAMPGGGELRIRSRLEKDHKNGMVEIRDTGSGIPEEKLGHIFDPFFTMKEEGEGTGLGLSIVYGIVKSHQGVIKVESQVGKGTSFVLKFPTS